MCHQCAVLMCGSRVKPSRAALRKKAKVAVARPVPYAPRPSASPHISCVRTFSEIESLRRPFLHMDMERNASYSAGLVGWLSCGEPLIHCSNSLPLNTQPHLCDEEGSSARLLIGSLQAVANNVKGGRSVLSQMRRRAGETIKNHSRMQVCQLVHAIHFLSTFESTRLQL